MVTREQRSIAINLTVYWLISNCRANRDCYLNNYFHVSAERMLSVEMYIGLHVLEKEKREGKLPKQQREILSNSVALFT